MAMQGKYGIRKNTRIAASDYADANALQGMLLKILSAFGRDMGLEVPRDFPEQLHYPPTGSSANSKGKCLMEYTLYLTKHAYQLLAMAERRHGFVYKIESINRNNRPLYYVQCNYIGSTPVTCVHSDYMRSLLWIVYIFMKSMEAKYRKIL